MCILSWVICKLACHRGCEPCAHAVIHLWVYSKVTYFQWFCQVLELKQIVIVTFLDLLNPSDHAALVLKHFFTRWNWKNHTKKYKKKRPPYCVRTLKIHKMPPGCFLVVGIGSTWRYDPIFSLHNFCWAGNGYFSSQTVFTDTENIFSKKKPIRLTLA